MGRLGSGRVPIGVNTSDADFNSVEKTGGGKTVNLAHSHTVNAHSHTVNSHKHLGNFGWDANAWFASVFNGTNTVYVADNNRDPATGARKNHNLTLSSGNVETVRLGYTGDASPGTNSVSPGTNSQLSNTQSVLQPYITCYMWKRTAG